MTHLANTIDYSSLSKPVTLADLHRLRGIVDQAGQQKAARSTRIMYAVAIILIMVGSGVVTHALRSGDPNASPLSIWAIMGGVALLFGLIASFYDDKKRARMTRFAEANNIRYLHSEYARGRSGLLFEQGHSRTIDRALLFRDDTEVGNYRYTTGSGKHKTTHYWSYARLKLPRKLPHMVLDAKQNNFLSVATNLPTSFNRSQVLSLEGNFDKYFTLYAPATYRTDALYVLTPDVMVALIDYGQAYDIEILDDSLLLYTKHTLALDQPTHLEPLLSMIDIIGGEVRSQTDTYRDERVGDRTANSIGSSGRRLQTKLSPVSRLVIIALILWFGTIAYSMFT